MFIIVLGLVNCSKSLPRLFDTLALKRVLYQNYFGNALTTLGLGMSIRSLFDRLETLQVQFYMFYHVNAESQESLAEPAKLLY